MNGNPARRVADKSVVALASRSLWDWIERHAPFAVLLVTLFLTSRVIEWAMDFGNTHYSEQGMHIAGIIGAVLGPWSLMQGGMFAFYINLLVHLKGQPQPTIQVVTPAAAPPQTHISVGAAASQPADPDPAKR